MFLEIIKEFETYQTNIIFYFYALNDNDIMPVAIYTLKFYWVKIKYKKIFGYTFWNDDATNVFKLIWFRE